MTVATTPASSARCDSLIQSIVGVLVASRPPDGENIAATDFVNRLDVGDLVVTGGRGRWSSSTIDLFAVSAATFMAAAEPSAAFEAELEARLSSAARWIAARAATLEALANELTIFLLLDVNMDQDQLDLTLPVDLLAACARARIKLQLVTND